MSFPQISSLRKNEKKILHFPVQLSIGSHFDSGIKLSFLQPYVTLMEILDVSPVNVIASETGHSFILIVVLNVSI